MLCAGYPCPPPSPRRSAVASGGASAMLDPIEKPLHQISGLTQLRANASYFMSSRPSRLAQCGLRSRKSSRRPTQSDQCTYQSAFPTFDDGVNLDTRRHTERLDRSSVPPPSTSERRDWCVLMRDPASLWCKNCSEARNETNTVITARMRLSAVTLVCKMEMLTSATHTDTAQTNLAVYSLHRVWGISYPVRLQRWPREA